MPKKVIPLEFIPDVGTHTLTIEGRPYLVANDAMYTFYQRSLGEFSDFFLALRDAKRILGCRCPRCGVVRVPPFLTRCPDCDFTPTEGVEVSDVGTMLSTPPITYFANALFQQQVPFGRGRVVLGGADTALSVNVYTTTGILVPGIIRKGTEMKVVFRDERVGEISDIFCVPTSELTAAQVAKRGLEASELDWAGSREPALPAPSEAERACYREQLAALRRITADLAGNERARKDIAQWRRSILVRSSGGEVVLRIDDGDLTLSDERSAVDLVLVCRDLGTLVDGLSYRRSLTESIIRRELWISKNVEFTTIFKLERMARSLARSKKT